MKWRQSENGRKSLAKSLAKSVTKRKEWAKEYYKKNKVAILKRTSEYNRTHPEVSVKSQIKNRDKNIIRGRIDREYLKPHYVKSLIKNCEGNITVHEKEVSVLVERIKSKIEESSEFKVCKDCTNVLPVFDFNKNGKRRDGKIRYNNFCKKCYSIRRKKYELNIDKARASSKKYYLKKKNKLHGQYNNS